jgi:predicted dehydrogenase
MNSKLKAAIGYMGEIRHRMVDQHDSAELVTICDNDTSKIKSNLNCKIVTDPSDEINSDVDIVFICTPNHLIPDLTIKCLNRGKHAFCEKSPGRTLEDIADNLIVAGVHAVIIKKREG